jgi:radical SAM superfamily enzyme YgiQ (UPF0313 family)
MYMHILESCYNNIKNIPTESLHLEAEKLTNQDAVAYIKQLRPTEVGIICSGSNPSASTMTMTGATELCRLIKHEMPGQKVFLWGGHPTVEPHRTKIETGADRIIIGDDFGVSVNQIPPVNWENIDPYKYRAHNWHCFGDLENRSPYGVIWTTLGCPYQCEFCCINNVFQQRVYKMRDIIDVVNEIDNLVNVYNVHNIKIMDELFVTNNKRVEEFCDMLIDRDYHLNMWAFARTDTVNPKILEKLKKAGVNWLAYGFETVKQSSINNVHKNTKIDTYDKVIQWTNEAGINIIADFIAGFWDDNYDSLTEMYAYMCRHNFEFINLYPLFAYPGTPLYTNYIKQGIIKPAEKWDEYSLYGYNCKPCPTKHLTSAEVLKWRDDRYVDYYKRASYLDKIERKFGKSTRDHVFKMADKHLTRKLYDTKRECSIAGTN